MANTFKRTALALDGTVQTLYTVPAATTTVVIGLRLANKDGVNDASATVWVSDGTTDFHFGPRDVLIPAKGSLEFVDGKLVLQAGDSIKVQASATALLDAVLSVMEMT